MTGIFSKVAQIFLDMGKFVVDMVGTDAMPKDIIFLVGLGLFVIFVMITIIRTSFSYEMRLAHAIDKINAYLYKHPDISEENVVEFNEIMKTVPQQMRNQWQLFMLYREGNASSYLCQEKVVDQPIKTSTYMHSVRTLGTIYDIFVILCAFIVFAGLLQISGDNVLGYNIFFGITIPVVLIILKNIFMLFIKSRLNNVTKDLYLNYNVFERAIDKATVALPEYVDYEILFTRSEIKQGIPILKDYLERREKLKAEELERAKQSMVEHEKYDFSALGVNASTLLERTVKECENYINNRKRLLTQIEQVEGELQSYKNNYELTNKEFIRKQQASKENLERFRQAQETATNRIEVTGIRKQQEEEMKKQEQYEKDAQEALNNYNAEKAILDEKIEKLEQELEAKKKYIEDAIMIEFKGYADRIFDELKYVADEQVKNEKLELMEENKRLQAELERRMAALDGKDKALQIKEGEVDRQRRANQAQKDEMNKLANEFSEKSRQLADARGGKAALGADDSAPVYDDNGGYFDKQGYYRYKNGTYYDPQGLFHDGKGKVFSADGKLLGTEDAEGKLVPIEGGDAQAATADAPATEEAKAADAKPKAEGEETKVADAPTADAPTADAAVTDVATTDAATANADEAARVEGAEEKPAKKTTTRKSTTTKSTTAKKTTAKKAADGAEGEPAKKTTTRKKKAETTDAADGTDSAAAGEGKDKSLEEIEKEIAKANEELEKNKEDLNNAISDTDDVIK